MPPYLGPFNLILLAMPGVALLIAVRIMFGSKPFAVNNPSRLLLSIAGWLMILWALIGAVVVMTGYFSVGVLVLAVIVLLMAVNVYRRGEHRSLLWSLALSAERGIPLTETAMAFADEHPGDTAARAMALADYLKLGLPLDAAARHARLKMSTGSRLATRLGTSLNLLGPALRQQMQDTHSVEGMLHSLLARFYYLGVVVLVGSGVVSFMMLKIVPVFEKMFSEFGLQLPPMTVVTIEVSRFFVESPLALLTFLLYPPFVLAMFLGTLLYVGWLPRDLPLLNRFFRRYDGSQILRALALVVRNGRPIQDALKLLGEHYPLRSVAWRLKLVAARVDQGADWCDALHSFGFIIATDAAVLKAAQRAGNLPWALEEMADSALRRQAYHLQAWYNVLFPLVLLTFGMFVFYFVVSMFLPLISLIQGLT